MKTADHGLQELSRYLTSYPQVLSEARFELFNEIAPLSRRVVVLRIGVGSTGVLDVLCDPTDSETNSRAFAHVCFSKCMTELTDWLPPRVAGDLGKKIVAYPLEGG